MSTSASVEPTLNCIACRKRAFWISRIAVVWSSDMIEVHNCLLSWRLGSRDYDDCPRLSNYTLYRDIWTVHAESHWFGPETRVCRGKRTYTLALSTFRNWDELLISVPAGQPNTSFIVPFATQQQSDTTTGHTRPRRMSDAQSITTSIGDGRAPKARRNRTGCLVCRSRRIKCSEDKPECQQCVRHNAEVSSSALWLLVAYTI